MLSAGGSSLLVLCGGVVAMFYYEGVCLSDWCGRVLGSQHVSLVPAMRGLESSDDSGSPVKLGMNQVTTGKVEYAVWYVEANSFYQALEAQITLKQDFTMLACSSRTQNPPSMWKRNRRSRLVRFIRQITISAARQHRH